MKCSRQLAIGHWQSVVGFTHQPSTINHQPRIRAAFTLVELLVAMGIFIILASIAISAFRATTDDDRIAAAAQQIKSSIEGAKSRALRDRAPRGIRFIRDPNNPSLCTSLQYIGATANDEGLIDDALGIDKSVSYFSRFDPDGVLEVFPTPDAQLGTPVRQQILVPLHFNSAGTVVLATDTVVAWRILRGQGLLVPGLRIQVPPGTGRYYVVENVFPVDPTVTPGNEVFALQLSEPLEGSTDIRQTLPSGAQIAGFVPKMLYSLELGFGPLAEDQPIALPKGTVLDLDGSAIPAAWRPADTLAPANTITAAEFPANLDLVFSSAGKLMNAPASAGMIHFYIGSQEEVDKYNQRRFETNLTQTERSNPTSFPGIVRPVLQGEPPDVPSDDPFTNGAGNDETQLKPARWVTLLTASGQLYSSDIDLRLPATPPAMTRDRIAFQRLFFAKRGEEAGR